MGYMKSVDIVLSEYKLSDAQKNAVVNIMSGGTEKVQVRTYASLEKKGLIHTTPDGWVLDESFHTELVAAYSKPEPREEPTAWESLGEIPAKPEPLELDEEPVQWDEHLDQEQSDEPAVPFFNRKALRDMRRHQARTNRRQMREKGKRIKRFGQTNAA